VSATLSEPAGVASQPVRLLVEAIEMLRAAALLLASAPYSDPEWVESRDEFLRELAREEWL
jgi:hypothetical protein